MTAAVADYLHHHTRRVGKLLDAHGGVVPLGAFLDMMDESQIFVMGETKVADPRWHDGAAPTVAAPMDHDRPKAEQKRAATGGSGGGGSGGGGGGSWDGRGGGNVFARMNLRTPTHVGGRAVKDAAATLSGRARRDRTRGRFT